MYLPNLKINLGASAIATLGLLLISCGGGSVTGYNSASGKGSSGTTTSSSGFPAPTVTVTVGSSSLAYTNTGTTVSWTSTNSTSCTSSGGGGTGKSGSFSTGTLTTTKTYSVTCDGAGGSANQSKTITVALSTITGFVNAGGAGNVTVTSANNLSSGSIITINGTTNYNGTYTVVSATSTNFVITSSFFTASDSGTWQLGGGMISSCLTTGSTSAITLSTVPSRFTGVAPLSVFFDASDTTATATTKPLHNLEYKWDFGDATGSPVSGTTWGTGSRAGVSSRNTAIGPEAAHVFETPGIYTASLTATDGTNTVANNCARIVVLNPDTEYAGGNTICFSTGTIFTGCPSGATTVQQSSFTTAINAYQATGKRLLFKRGDTFTAGTTIAFVNATGPGTIGAFGVGSLPLIQGSASGQQQMLALGHNSPRNISDWRVMDLHFDGASNQSASSADYPAAITSGGAINDVTILRVNASNIQRAFMANGDALSKASGDLIFDGWTIQDSSSTGIAGCQNGEGLNGPCDYRAYMAGNRMAIMGNDFDNLSTGGTHVIRIQYINKGVISNNRLANAGGTQHTLKIHAPLITADNTMTAGGSSGYSQRIVISDNKIVGNTNAWTLSFGPQNSASDERVRDIIFERNWITGGTGTQLSIESSADRSTFRNNIIDTSNGVYQSGLGIGQRGIEPVPDDIQIYNNTLYSSTSTSEYRAIKLTTVTNVTVKNNLAYTPNVSSPVMVFGTPSGLVQSNNSTNDQVKSTSPGWASSTPTVPSDFKPVGGSYALGNGVSVPVFSDFFLQTRTTNDLGAAIR
jgi:hypothetical protein